MADPHIETYSHAPTAERAAETAATHAGQGHTAAGTTESTEPASGGLPQFQFQHWPGQIAYLLILFAILYVLMSRVFGPRIRRIFDERERTIGEALAGAKSVQDAANAEAAASTKALDDARAAAHKTAADAKAKAAAEAQARRNALDAELNTKLAAAETRIRAARDQSMASVGAVAAEAVHAIVEKLTGVAAEGAEVGSAIAAQTSRGAA